MAAYYYYYISIKGNSYFLFQNRNKSHNEVDKNNAEKGILLKFYSIVCLIN